MISSSSAGKPSSSSLRVFADDQDDVPLMSFQAPTTVAHVKAALAIPKGGLRPRSTDEWCGEGPLPGGDYIVVGYTLRACVSIKGAKLVIPIKDCKRRVKTIFAQLLSVLSDYIGEDVRISELRVNGYSLPANGIIDEVLSDGCSLDIVDFDLWVEEQLKRCEKPWVRLEQSDYEWDKWIEVGATVDDKHLYLRFGQGTGADIRVLYFELYGRETLQNFGRDGKHSIIRKEGTAGAGGERWVIEAWFVATNRRVSAVLLSVKSAAYTDANVREVKLELHPRLGVKVGDTGKALAVVEPRLPRAIGRSDSPSLRENHRSPDRNSKS